MFFAIIWLQARCSSVDSIPVHVVLLENNTSCFLELSNDYGVNFVLQSRHQHRPQDLNNPNQRLHAKTTTWLEFIANDPWHGSLRLAVDGTGAIHGGNGHVAMDQGPLLTVTFDSSQHAFVASGLKLGSRRRLAYKKYSCHKDNKVTFRIGVVVDPAASGRLCDIQSACEDRIRKLVEDASVPFERNFGIMLRAKEITFPPAKLLPWMLRCEFVMHHPGERGRHLEYTYGIFQAYLVDRQVADKYATWVLLTGCLGVIRGMASGHSVCTKACAHEDGNMFTSSAVVAVTGRDDTTWMGQVETLAHELGHNFGAGHTFSADMWGDLQPEIHRERTMKGLMDYIWGSDSRIWDGEGDNEVQFHSMHERFVCSTINRAMGEEPDTTIFNGNRTAHKGMISSSACFETVRSTSEQSTPVESTSGKSTPAESTSAKSTPAESTSAKSTPVESTPVESTPVGSTSAKSTPAESTSAKSTPAESILPSEDSMNWITVTIAVVGFIFFAMCILLAFLFGKQLRPITHAEPDGTARLRAPTHIKKKHSLE